VGESTARGLVALRTELRLDPDAKVRVVFEGEHRVPLFECDTCGELLRWLSDKSWYECPTCEYELTAPEAEDLLGLGVRRLQLVIEDVRRKQGLEQEGEQEERVGLWRRVVGWFYRIVRRS